ncbi:MAG: type IX secretion system membrane protein PorP/SprF [Cryomorphaceae bacterium]
MLRSSMIVLIASLSTLAYAQVPPNYIFQSSVINQNFPELMAHHGALDVNAVGQQQWAGFEGYPESYNINTAGYWHAARTAFGLSYENDQLGSFEFNRVQLAISPRFQVGKDLVFSSSAAVAFNQYNYQPRGDLIYFQHPPIKEVHASYRLGSGLIYKQHFLALNYHFDLSPNEENQLFRRYQLLNVLLGTSFDLGNIHISPQLEAVSDLASMRFQMSITSTYKGFQVALGYDHRGDVKTAVGYTYQQRFSIHYGYSMDTNPLAAPYIGTHSLGLRAVLFKDKARKVFLTNIGLI